MLYITAVLGGFVGSFKTDIHLQDKEGCCSIERSFLFLEKFSNDYDKILEQGTFDRLEESRILK